MLQTSLELNKKMLNELYEKTQVRLGLVTNEKWACDECFDCFILTESDEIIPTEKCRDGPKWVDGFKVTCLSASQFGFCERARELYEALKTGMSDAVIPSGGCDVDQLKSLIYQVEKRLPDEEILFWNKKSRKGWQDNIFGESVPAGGGVDIAKVCSGELSKIYTEARRYTSTRETSLTGELSFGNFHGDIKKYLTQEKKYELLRAQPFGATLMETVVNPLTNYQYTQKLSSINNEVFGGYDKFDSSTRRWGKTDKPTRLLYGCKYLPTAFCCFPPSKLKFRLTFILFFLICRKIFTHDQPKWVSVQVPSMLIGIGFPRGISTREWPRRSSNPWPTHSRQSRCFSKIKNMN